MLANRTVEFPVYLTEDDHKKLKDAAIAADMPASDLARKAIAFYMEHELKTDPISAKTHKGGARKGAGRKPKTDDAQRKERIG